jgi:hypothetical protein
MSGAIPSLRQHAFMAWCSVKKSTGTTLPLPSPLPLPFTYINSYRPNAQLESHICTSEDFTVVITCSKQPRFKDSPILV